MKRIYLIAFLFGVTSFGTAGEEKPIALPDLEGKMVEPLASKDGKPAVLIFITTDCPIANGYAPEISRIVADYSKKGVRFTLVHVDPGLSEADARKHSQDYRLQGRIVIDRKHELVKATGATMTPEAAVLDGEGKLAYLGRIDDQYAGYGERRAAPRERNLRLALDALLAGKPVAKARAEALGCFIPDLD